MHPLSYFQDSDLDDFVNFQTTGVVELRDWQRRGKSFFKQSGNNALFEVVTAGGKTYFAIDIVKDVLEHDPNVRVIIAVPKNVILETGCTKN